ncbi:MAG: hypothetical protein DYH08_11390 [Actinobacteria bacterium ATB1]|nr:hypothetical protein [Actinobacteria bacterium ATB1]
MTRQGHDAVAQAGRAGGARLLRASQAFMVGATFFAIGSAPGFSSLVAPTAVGAIFFAGSIFFTTGGALTFADAEAHRRAGGSGGRAKPDANWYSAAVQLVGTILFNFNTFRALTLTFGRDVSDLIVWRPNLLGSICFLVASELAIVAVSRRWVCLRWADLDCRSALVNMLGSIFFMASAAGSYVVPSTGDPANAALANGGTFLGALCFLAGGWWSAGVVGGRGVSPDAQ